MRDYTELEKKLREYAAGRKGEIADLTKEAADAIQILSKKPYAKNGLTFKISVDMERIEELIGKIKALQTYTVDGEEILVSRDGVVDIFTQYIKVERADQ